MSMLLGRTEFGHADHKGRVLSREEVMDWLNSWVLNPRLQLHMLQVGHLMRCWALEKIGLDESDAWRWEMAGILHDADWDQWPDTHCRKIVEALEEKQIDPEIIRAIASHGHVHFGVEPVTEMDKMLYAFDELSGFIHAYSLMRPGGYDGMDTKGVKKRLKDKAFAAGVSREDIQDACTRAGIQLDELILFIIPRQADRTAALAS
ncbi:MAG: HD domain-containing protein [Bacteroidota bacterium]|jgi:predicted hydrolase (HD superfamily)